MKTRSFSLASFLLMTTYASIALADQHYEAQVLRVKMTQSQLTGLLAEYTAAHGLVATPKHGEKATFEAVTPVDVTNGVVSRARWIYSVRDGEIAIERRFEVSFDNNWSHWESSALVCDSYQYLEERAQMAQLFALAVADTSALHNPQALSANP